MLENPPIQLFETRKIRIENSTEKQQQHRWGEWQKKNVLTVVPKMLNWFDGMQRHSWFYLDQGYDSEWTVSKWPSAHPCISGAMNQSPNSIVNNQLN